LIKEIVDQRKSILIADTRLQPGWASPPGTQHVISWLGVPLVAGGCVIGIYSLDKNEPAGFNQEHVRLAESLVGQAPPRCRMPCSSRR